LFRADNDSTLLSNSQRLVPSLFSPAGAHAAQGKYAALHLRTVISVNFAVMGSLGRDIQVRCPSRIPGGRESAGSSGDNDNNYLGNKHYDGHIDGRLGNIQEPAPG
jgi:hypothetical protein